MSEKKKAWRDFWDEHNLDKRPPQEISVMHYGWRRGFDKGYEMASQNARKDELADGNVRFIPKSDGVLTGNFIIGAGYEEGCSSGVSKKIEEVDETANASFALSMVALVISVTVFFIVAVNLLWPEA